MAVARSTSALVTAFIAASTVACTGEQDGPGSPADPVLSTPSESASPDAPEEAGDDVVRSVTVANFLFQPKTIRVSPGDVIELANTNPQTPHTFTVPGEDIAVQLGPQTTETVAIDLEPGTFAFVCEFHESQGMTGTLEVS